MTPRHTEQTDQNITYAQVHIRLMYGDASTGNRPKLKRGSQNYLTYAHLVRGKRLNTVEAMNLGLGMRLPNRINALRDLGVPIESRVIEKVGNIKEYWISEAYLKMFKGGDNG